MGGNLPEEDNAGEDNAEEDKAEEDKGDKVEADDVAVKVVKAISACVGKSVKKNSPAVEPEQSKKQARKKTMSCGILKNGLSRKHSC